MQCVHDSVRHGERAATGSRHTKGDKPCTLCYTTHITTKEDVPYTANQAAGFTT